MSNNSLLLGTVYGEETKRLPISSTDLLHHMLVVGQSGSGKSFMLARLIEELLLRTRARVVVIDPNGDFRSIADVAPHEVFYESFKARFDALSSICRTNGLTLFDDYDEFRNAWELRYFQYIIANPNRDAQPRLTGDRIRRSDLFVHWQHLKTEQDFLIDLLEIEPRTKAKSHLAIRACNFHLTNEKRQGDFPEGFGLLEVIDTARLFLNRNIGLARFEFVKDLTEADWWLVYAYLQQMYHKHEWLWWNEPAQRIQIGVPVGIERKRDMLGHLLGAFVRYERSDAWNACVVGLDNAPQDDGLLAVNFALYRLWKSAQHQWRRFTLDPAADDTRVPTFVVIDEAHNYAPTDHRNEVQKRVTDKLIQIAAEGRKYGLYLILATQRPRKLHPSLVLECEKVCVLRVQSRVEQDFAAKEFAIAQDAISRVGNYKKGQALLSGRWVDGKQVEAMLAPARTNVGGGGVSDLWLNPPSLQRRIRPTTPLEPAMGYEGLEISEAEDDELEIIPASDPEQSKEAAITSPLVASENVHAAVEVVMSRPNSTANT